jgi:hypothetical protein
MKRALALLVTILVVFGTMYPNPASAGRPWRGGHGGHHGVWWLPGAILGGLALGAVAVVTAPFVALSAVAAALPATYEPPVVYAPPPAYAAPAPVYYQEAPSYAPQIAAVQREVVYPNGRYVLYGDGVRQRWQWVWVPSASPPPPLPPPQP